MKYRQIILLLTESVSRKFSVRNSVVGPGQKSRSTGFIQSRFSFSVSELAAYCYNKMLEEGSLSPGRLLLAQS